MKKLEAEFETIIRSVIDACSDCDTCRFLMNEDCLFFPELYRLVDQERENGQTVREHELQLLVELCTLCGLCPCPNIRNDVMRAKLHLSDKMACPYAIAF
jgi:glycerol-3-phosphate dehydrogenase subunit C